MTTPYTVSHTALARARAVTTTLLGLIARAMTEPSLSRDEFFARANACGVNRALANALLAQASEAPPSYAHERHHHHHHRPHRPRPLQRAS